jgi:hypothetical protein
MPLTDSERRRRYLRFAGILCYVEAVLMGLSAFSIAVPALSGAMPSAALANVVALIAIGAGYVVAGRFLRGYRRPGAVIALGSVACAVGLRMLLGAGLLNGALAIDAGLLVLLALGWRELDAPRTPSEL